MIFTTIPLTGDVKKPLPEPISLEKYAPERMNQGLQGSCVGGDSHMRLEQFPGLNNIICVIYSDVFITMYPKEFFGTVPLKSSVLIPFTS